MFVANKYMRFGGKDVAPGDVLNAQDVAANKAYFLMHKWVLEVGDDWKKPDDFKVASDGTHEKLQAAEQKALEAPAKIHNVKKSEPQAEQKNEPKSGKRGRGAA